MRLRLALPLVAIGAGIACEAGVSPTWTSDVVIPLPTGVVISPTATATSTPPVPTALCASTATLVGCWSFDGGGFQDESMYAQTVTPTNVGFGSGYGVSGSSAKFTAASDFVVEHASSLTTAEITIELAVSADLLGANVILIDKSESWLIELRADGTVECRPDGSPPNVSTGSGLFDTAKWRHIACTYDGTDTRIYVDGEFVAVSSGPGAPLTATSSDVRIGEDGPDGGMELFGRLDSIRVWSYARTAKQICEAAVESAGGC